MKRKKSQSAVSVKMIIIAFVMAALIVGYYFYLSNRTAAARENDQAKESLTLVEETLLRNLDSDYPPSPKEVVRYYAQITKCFYDGDYSQEQLKQLAVKARELFDEELLANQTEEEYLQQLNADIQNFSSMDVKISSYTTSSSVDVEYSTTPQGELASLYCMFNIRQGSSMKSSNNEFVLRKDEAGHWKILGWKLDEGDSNG